MIFDYVKATYKWNGIDGKNFYNGIKKTLKEKSGNTADINLMLIAMLRYAGIKANPLIISTKDNLIPMYPTVDRLNYVIAHAEINGEQFFMDATDEFSNVNILPIKDYNWEGVYINNDNKIWKKINIQAPNIANSTYLINLEMSEDGDVDGSVKSRYINHAAYNYRVDFKNTDIETYLTQLESQYDDIEIFDFENKNSDTHQGFVTESFNFHGDNLIENIADKIYFKPLLFFGMNSSPFTQENRKYPIDFGVPTSNNFNVIVLIPEEYQVESVPEAVIVKLPEGMGEFKFSAMVEGRTLQFQVGYEITQTIFAATKYQILKEFYQFMINKQAEQVVLSKA